MKIISFQNRAQPRAMLCHRGKLQPISNAESGRVSGQSLTAKMGQFIFVTAPNEICCSTLLLLLSLPIGYPALHSCHQCLSGSTPSICPILVFIAFTQCVHCTASALMATCFFIFLINFLIKYYPRQSCLIKPYAATVCSPRKVPAPCTSTDSSLTTFQTIQLQQSAF